MLSEHEFVQICYETSALLVCKYSILVRKNPPAGQCSIVVESRYPGDNFFRKHSNSIKIHQSWNDTAEAKAVVTRAQAGGHSTYSFPTLCFNGVSTRYLSDI